MKMALNIITGVLAAFIFINYLLLTVTMAANGVKFSTVAIPVAVMLTVLIPCLLLIFFGDRVPKTAFVLQIVFVVGMLMYTVTFIASAVYTISGVNCDAVPEKCDAIIVFGAKVNGTEPSRALRERLDASLAVYEKHPASLFILSGGQGSDEKISEAQCMENYLLSHGVPRDQIIKEARSTDTVTNIKNSKKILEDMGIKENTVCVSSEYHIKRIEKICKDEGLTAQTYGAVTRPFIKLWTNLVREYMSNIKYALGV